MISAVMIQYFYCFMAIMALGTSHGLKYDQRDILIYEDLACLPITSENQVVAYNCDDAFSDNCLYQGKKYEIGKVLPHQISLLSCSSSCRCRSNGFLCANLRCPEIGGVTLVDKKCYHTYSLTGCCNNGEICPPFDKLPTCEVDGKKYLKGQRFYPKNTSLHCVCDEGFQGKYENFCRTIACGIKLKFKTEIENRCAPFYDDKDQRNCPSKWICPSEQDKDEIIKSSQSSDDSVKCVYGKKSLNVGDYFQRTGYNYIIQQDEITKCECIIPPLLTCGTT